MDEGDEDSELVEPGGLFLCLDGACSCLGGGVRNVIELLCSCSSSGAPVSEWVGEEALEEEEVELITRLILS